MRWPAVTLVSSGVDVARADRWQWLAGNLIVNVVLALQPELMFFHAATIAIGSRGVLLMGERGSGKTSLALALAARGHGFLGDEIGALRLASGELVPLRRSAQVRQHGADSERLTVPVGTLFPQATVRPVPLHAVVRLRRFASVTQLEPWSLGHESLDGLTLMTCSVAGNGNAVRIARLLRLLATIPTYALDSASPERSAELLEQTLGV